MARSKILTALASDRDAYLVFWAASLALTAAGLDPRLLEPGSAPVRAALRSDPGLQSMAFLGVLLQAAFLVLGGFLADTRSSNRLVRAGLAGLLVASLLGIVAPTGPWLIATRVLAWASVGAIVPFAIASIARVYRGKMRAAALGVAFAIAGITPLVSGVLAAIIVGPEAHWPPFLACAVASLLASVAWRPLPSGAPIADSTGRSHAVAFAIGTIGVVAAILGVVDLGDPNDAVRIVLVIGGLAALGWALSVRARLARAGSIAVDARAVIVALVVGASIGFAQAVPLLHLPLFFQLVQGATPLLALLATLPFILSTMVAGSRVEDLLARVRPRTLVVGGLLVVAVADLVLALILGRGTAYIWFIIPFMAIAAGSVVSSSVRTALIFASVRSDLRASAAATNDVSGSIGGRIGTIVATYLMTRVALDAFAGSAAQADPARAETMVRRFRDLLEAIGLPEYAGRIVSLQPAVFDSYAEAGVTGIQASLIAAAAIGLLGAAIASRLPDTLEPLVTTWDLADERATASSPAPGKTATA